jgi:hypothetical protein
MGEFLATSTSASALLRPDLPPAAPTARACARVPSPAVPRSILDEDTEKNDFPVASVILGKYSLERTRFPVLQLSLKIVERGCSLR